LPRELRGRAAPYNAALTVPGACSSFAAMGTLRIWCLGLLALGFWVLSVYGTGPAPLPADAPATEFSAARADAVLARLLGPEVPHPVGSPAAAAFRARLKAELDRLGIAYEEQTRQSYYGRRRWRACGTVTNIHARAIAGTGPEVLLVAHTDSNPRGPGAADDGSGVAVILETLRALKARPLTGSPVAALFTDGEEKGLLGAAAYVRDPANIARTGAVVNVEARGNQGRSLLFQTSPGDAALVGLYAKTAPHPSTSSLYGDIYRVLPNDTDLTPFLAAGVAGVNFAFIGNMRDYHSPTDRRANISQATLQHQGENVLAMALALRQADPAALKGGGNAIYLDIFNRWLPRLPMDWALPLAVATFLLIALAGGISARRREVPRPVMAALAPLFLLLLCLVAGFVLYAPMALAGTPTLTIANPFLRALLVATGVAGPWPGNPLWLRLALAFGTFAAALWTARWAGPIACWLWFAGLAIACAVWLPGLSPYFLFPALVAAPLLLLTARRGRALALFLAALAGLSVWSGFNAMAEDIEGLRLHPLFTLSAAFVLLSLLPLMAGRRLGGSAILSAMLAIVFAIVAAFNIA
jgi:hypothetical protein